MKNYNAAAGEPVWSDRDRLAAGVHYGQVTPDRSHRAAERYALLTALAAGQEKRRPAPNLWSRLTWRRSRAAVAKTV
ncbi:MAG: hypothetical protein ABWX96_08110 [Propionibacteriaceae bacterium]